LREALSDYHRLLGEASKLASLYRPHDPGTLNIAVQLEGIRAKLAALPFPTPDPSAPETARAALSTAQLAAAALADSDRRIDILREALSREDSDQVALALAALMPFDRARDAATGVVDLAVAEEAARTALKASDGRIAVAKAALDRFRAYPSVAAAQAAVTQAQNLNDLDRSRDLKDSPSILQELDRLRGALSDYHRLLDEVSKVAPLYRAHDPETLDIAMQLAVIRTKLAALPFPMPDPSAPEIAREALSTAQSAAAALADSDRRIEILRKALSRKKSDQVGLALALAALTPFDRARAAATGVVSVAQAEDAARTAIPKAAHVIAVSYQAAPERADAERLVQLSKMAATLGAKLDDDTRAVTDRAQADVAGSEARLAALRDTAAAWASARASGQRNKATEKRVRQVLSAIVPAGTAEANSYDAAAMGPPERRALGELLGALVQIPGRLPAGQRPSVSVYVDAADLNVQPVEALPRLVEQEIERAGFSLASGQQQAAITVRLSNPAVRDAGFNATTGRCSGSDSINPR
jgi:hypothetical protein